MNIVLLLMKQEEPVVEASFDSSGLNGVKYREETKREDQLGSYGKTVAKKQ